MCITASYKGTAEEKVLFLEFEGIFRVVGPGGLEPPTNGL